HVGNINANYGVESFVEILCNYGIRGQVPCTYRAHLSKFFAKNQYAYFAMNKQFSAFVAE
ncbi:MAG: hypothetical protein MJY65_05625, partial [Bacteroidaceae bacterium]|nr:hypothetical protein [Bacteroidaceae bacterium]